MSSSTSRWFCCLRCLMHVYKISAQYKAKSRKKGKKTIKKLLPYSSKVFQSAEKKKVQVRQRCKQRRWKASKLPPKKKEYFPFSFSHARRQFKKLISKFDIHSLSYAIYCSFIRMNRNINCFYLRELVLVSFIYKKNSLFYFKVKTTPSITKIFKIQYLPSECNYRTIGDLRYQQ